MKLRTTGLLLCVVSLSWAAPKLPGAAQVLDRYVEVTGGRAAWLSKITETDEMEGRALDSGSVVLRATVSASRNGNSYTRLSVPEKGGEGIFNGVAWALTSLSGPRIKHGLDREEAVRSVRMLEEASWRDLYPKSKVDAMEDIEGHRCYRVRLLPSSAGKTEWFDVDSGLLVKRSSSGQTEEVSVVEAWGREGGLLQPTALLATRDGFRYRLRLLSVKYNAGETFSYPADVESLLALERSGTALPNAEELIERHIFASGGAETYQNIRTQHITGTLEFVAKNLEAETEAYSAGGGRYYQAVDMPGLGRNEQGSDGHVSWERSPALGSRTKERRDMSGLGVTLDAAQVVGWRYMLGSVRTEAQEIVDGKDCYRVHLTLRDSSDGGLRWYDRKTGLLYRSSGPVKTEMGTVPAVMTYVTYKQVEGLQWPVLIRMAMAGQEMIFTARNVELNRPIDEAAFTIPADLREPVNKP